MNSATTGWLFLVIVLVLSTFGLFWCFIAFFGLFSFLLGFWSLLYIQRGDVGKFYRNCTANPLTSENVTDGGLEKVVRFLISPKQVQKSDHRVTGSELIDSSLQEILGFIIRDYVNPWYRLVSIDEEFSQNAVRKTAQSLAINISNRVKEVDWIPFLTTRLVDDAASHLRLYKQARLKLVQDDKVKNSRSSPRRDQKSSPKRSHKRYKSETDISWYAGNKTTEIKEHEHSSSSSSKHYMLDQSKKTLEDHFFDLECQMENNTICRDVVCTNVSNEREFLSELVELLLYVLLPDDDFVCKPLRFILRGIFSSCVVYPVFTMISDPDYINQVFIWLCLSDNTLPSEIFLTTLRLSDNSDELKYTKEIVQKEIEILRSQDSGGEGDLSVKQQLSSLYYVLKLIDNRLSKTENFEQADLFSSNDYIIPLESAKKVNLPLYFILKNDVAVSYFVDYMSSHVLNHYLCFYLLIEAWKSSVEKQISSKTKPIYENTSNVIENIRSTALTIYEQHLTDQKIEIDQTLIDALLVKINNESPSEFWFDEISLEIYKKLEDVLPSFKASKAYVKLLQDLDLIHQPIAEEDTASLNSLESLEISESTHTNTHLKSNNSEPYLTVENCTKSMKHVRSLSDVTDLQTDPLSASKDIRNGDVCKEDTTKVKFEIDDFKKGEFTLSVRFIEAGIKCDRGKTYGIYAMQVTKQYDSGFIEQWHIYRRYSDFHDFHTKMKDKFPDLSKLAFPAKKTFHNMERHVLERRMRILGSYMQELCQAHVIVSHRGLKELLMTFLEQGDYDRATSGGPISHTIDTLVMPLKTGMKTIKNMPEQLINTVDEVVEGFNKVFHTKSSRTLEASKVGASLDIESDDNIPLRIMLLLMDELFDLKSRNQWPRRRIVTLLRQIVRTMFGDIVNRKILDYVSLITSPKNVAHYLHIFKQSFWPNGVKAESKPQRDEGVKYRTRIAAKVALLSCLSDELKHIIGSETTRKGLLTVFDLFQRPTLNRRLLYVLLEGVLSTLFPEKNMAEIFQKLHSKSKRFQEKQKPNALINR